MRGEERARKQYELSDGFRGARGFIGRAGRRPADRYMTAAGAVTQIDGFAGGGKCVRGNWRRWGRQGRLTGLCL